PGTNPTRKPCIKLQQTNIKIVSELKYLGIIWDRGLTWIPHLQYIRSKTNALARKAKLFLGINWGQNPHINKILYTTVIERICLYAATIWANPMQGRKQKQLLTIQRPFALMICKGFRTTATSAALTLAGIPPLYHRATQEAATTRILQLRQDATFNGHTFSPTSYEHLRHHSRQHPGDKGKGVIISIPKAPSSNITSAHPVYYTDGSKQDAGVGSAFLLTHHNEVITSWKGHLQPHNSIFQAEALAILKAIAHAARFNYRSPIICTDSQSTLHAIKNHRHTSPIIKDIQSLLQQHRFQPSKTHMGEGPCGPCWQ
ncbi:uncharacterized protein LOC118202873, partial [Stegodyphus dumicola]|uniref:uncharacterized protein LOC118202873 n=2 Tax=Stegodyphus dumicola TaxID=202533 RepID=UPI0015A8E462